MPIVQTSRKCSYCRRKTLHTRKVLGFGRGFAATVFTFGLFLPFWGMLLVSDALFGKWRCQSCGSGKML